MTRRLTHKDYTVGWVCALPIELAAAQTMLDEQHHDLPQNIDDANTYTLGRIGEHNVVLACLPAGQVGTNSAAAVAIQLKSTFFAIRFGLMVGIGGGVPSAEEDIRLGDIVVSQPGFLNTPPLILLTAISKLQANHNLGKSDLFVHISKLSGLPKFSRDQAGDDILFEAVYHHVRGSNCTSCDNIKKVERKARTVDTPEIHYGTIASGNQVMRDGAMRDQISSEFGGVLCFEMEAAGLMNSFPCLVIRGVCDYADSHKNKTWQPYASGTAAAYAKELLLVIPDADIVRTQTVDKATRVNHHGVVTTRPENASPTDGDEGHYQTCTHPIPNNIVQFFYYILEPDIFIETMFDKSELTVKKSREERTYSMQQRNRHLIEASQLSSTLQTARALLVSVLAAELGLLLNAFLQYVKTLQINGSKVDQKIGETESSIDGLSETKTKVEAAERGIDAACERIDQQQIILKARHLEIQRDFSITEENETSNIQFQAEDKFDSECHGAEKSSENIRTEGVEKAEGDFDEAEDRNSKAIQDKCFKKGEDKEGQFEAAKERVQSSRNRLETTYEEFRQDQIISQATYHRLYNEAEDVLEARNDLARLERERLSMENAALGKEITIRMTELSELHREKEDLDREMQRAERERKGRWWCTIL